MFKLALADDEGLILNSMASMIHWEKLGFTVKGCFTDGYDFIKAFERGEHYDAILTDIRMDGISGMDIAKYIYEKQLFIPIVFLSGYQEFEYAQMGMHYGVVEYLTKPCSIAKIEETMLKVANVLQNSVRSGNRVELMEETGEENNAADENNQELFSRICAYITDNCCKILLLEDVARVFFLHPAVLSRMFKQCAEGSFKAFLTKQRIKVANELLPNQNIKIYDIIQKVGYRDIHHFYDVYKKEMGITPTEYRSRCLRKMRKENMQ